jgi:RNA polymerase sigma factor (sigma-70 family)
MIAGESGNVLQQVRRLVAGPRPAVLSDRELLERFLAQGDEAAFTALVERHGAMVLGICRRVLGHAHDAEDACQATFLVLARRAVAIRKKESLGNWLHGVACRVAANLRRDRTRRRAREGPSVDVPRADTTEEVVWSDVLLALDAELSRLPERYRAPLVLCYLEGRTRDEAAQELGWSLGTLRGRLERGRDLLRARLARRGLTLSATLLAVALTEQTSSASLPATLTVATVKAALLARGREATAGVVSARVASLTEGVLRTMFLARVKTIALALFAVTALAGAGLLASRFSHAEPVDQSPRREAIALAPRARAPVPLPKDELGPEVNGLRARITLAQEKFRPGVPIQVSYVVKNVSKEEQILWHSGFWPNHQILVKDAAGKEPPLTAFGQQCRKAFAPGGERFKNVRVVVPPGGEDAAYEKYDLQDLYNLSRSGRYTVQYVYEEKQGGWEGRLPSNEVTFEFDATENKERTVEKDGVRFELLIPDTAWPVPENKPGGQSPVALGLRITNTTAKPFRFSAYDTLFPEVTGPDGKLLEPGVRLRTALRREADCPLVDPGESVTFPFGASLAWMPDGHLRLRGNRPCNGWVFVDPVKPGQYKVRVRYRNVEETFKPDGDSPVLKGVWTGEVTTPVVDVTVTKPETGDEKDAAYEESKAVRVDGVDFQAVIEKKRLVADPALKQPIDLGLRITNGGGQPLQFSLADTIRPLIETAGKPIKPGGGRNGTKRVEPVLLGPGKSTTIRWSARLEGLNDGKSLRLIWTDDTGWVWYFDGLGPGKYLLRFEYENTREQFWTGKATTNDAAFEILAP